MNPRRSAKVSPVGKAKRCAGPMWRPSERWRSGWDGEFESPLLQRGVSCEPEDDIDIPVPRGSTITYCAASQRKRWEQVDELRRHLARRAKRGIRNGALEHR